MPPAEALTEPVRSDGALKILAVDIGASHFPPPLKRAAAMQHAPIVKDKHIARLQRITPLKGRVIGQLVKRTDASI